MPEYDRITIKRVRQAQQKTGLPFCRETWRKYDNMGYVKALCPLEQIYVADGTIPNAPRPYLSGFMAAVDDCVKRDWPGPTGTEAYELGFEDGMAVRKEFFDD